MHWLSERDPSLRAAESISKLVFSYWSTCSWQRGLKLHSSGLQVHGNIWTSSGVTETPCSSRTEQTGWFAGVYRQHREVGGTCPWKALFHCSQTLSYLYKYPSTGAKVYDHHYLQKDITFCADYSCILFTCWLLIPLHTHSLYFSCQALNCSITVINLWDAFLQTCVPSPLLTALVCRTSPLLATSWWSASSLVIFATFWIIKQHFQKIVPPVEVRQKKYSF